MRLTTHPKFRITGVELETVPIVISRQSSTLTPRILVLSRSFEKKAGLHGSNFPLITEITGFHEEVEAGDSQLVLFIRRYVRRLLIQQTLIFMGIIPGAM